MSNATIETHACEQQWSICMVFCSISEPSTYNFLWKERKLKLLLIIIRAPEIKIDLAFMNIYQCTKISPIFLKEKKNVFFCTFVKRDQSPNTFIWMKLTEINYFQPKNII